MGWVQPRPNRWEAVHIEAPPRQVEPAAGVLFFDRTCAWTSHGARYGIDWLVRHLRGHPNSSVLGRWYTVCFTPFKQLMHRRSSCYTSRYGTQVFFAGNEPADP